MSGIDRSALQLAAIAGLPVLSVTHGIDRLRGLWQALYPAAGRCFVLCSNRLQAEAYRQGLSIHGGQIIGRGRPRGWSERRGSPAWCQPPGALPRPKDDGRLVPPRRRTRQSVAASPPPRRRRRSLRAAEHGATPAEQVRVIQEEYIRRVRTPGSHLVPRLKAGQ